MADVKNKPVDSIARVNVSRDGLEAKIFVEPPKYGGAPATTQTIENAINAAGVNFGFIAPTLNKLKQEPEYSREFLIARGVEPVNGADGSIKYKFTLKEARPKERNDGSVDYRNLGIVCNVKEGQVLAEITLPTKGTDGMTVTGKKIVPMPGKSISSPVGRNTVLSNDGTKLTSSINGHVSLDGIRVNVVDTFTVAEDVDISIGNIKAIANVSVCGNVLEGFTIEAEGNVDIGGTVEGGTIKAGGNITIHGGVVGRGRSKINCKGNFSSTFLENCEANAGGSIKAESIMNSAVKCGGKLELVGTRAKLMGGRCIVGQDLVASQIGSPAMLRTELILGVEPAVITHYAALAAEIKQLHESINKLVQIVDLLGKYEQMGKLPLSKKRMLLTSKVSLKASGDKLTSDEEEYKLLSEQIENSGKGKVICRGCMYRGVKLTIGIASINIDNDITSSSFALVDGKIAVTPTSPY